MAVSVLDRAKANLVYRHPFFASILMRRPLIKDETIPTAGVDARGNVYYNPKFIETLNLEQAIFLLCHEVMHVVCQHALRLKERDHLRWNLAGDAFINDILQADNIGQMIQGAVNRPGSRDKTTDQLYNELPPPKCSQCGGQIMHGQGQQGGQQQGQQGGGGQQQGQGQGKKKQKGKGQGGHAHGNNGQPCNCPGGGHGEGIGGIGQDLLDRGGPLSPDERKQIEAETKVAVAQAAQIAKAQGKLPGVLGGIVAKLIESKVPWYEVLERFMTSFAKTESTWAKRNRRYRNHYLPWVGKTPQMGDIVLQIDVSGSISQQELNHYAGHMARICEQCRPNKVHVLYVDTQVQKHLEFDPRNGDEVKLEFYSGGGTDMEAGFRYVEKNIDDAEVIICLTDGYTSFTKAPDKPVVWVVSSNVVPTYGEHVPFELRNE